MKMARTKQTPRIPPCGGGGISLADKLKRARETEHLSNESEPDKESVSEAESADVNDESMNVPECSGSFDRSEELPEFKRLCQESRSSEIRHLWSKVLNEVDEFKASVLNRIKFTNSLLPDLAKFFLKDSNSIDPNELKLMIEEKDRLTKDYAALGEAIKTINTMDLESFGSPAKLTEKLGQVTGPVVGKLISKILEHHQIIQEIETNLHLQSKRKKLLEEKVKAFKGIDVATIDTVELEQKAEVCKKAVLEIKREILSDYQENAEELH